MSDSLSKPEPVIVHPYIADYSLLYRSQSIAYKVTVNGVYSNEDWDSALSNFVVEAYIDYMQKTKQTPLSKTATNGWFETVGVVTFVIVFYTRMLAPELN